ncbi:hypothetical protein CF327_g7763, partial [Tilletia walkeri]
RLQQTQSAATALQQLQADLDEINERGFVGLADISRAADVKSSAIGSILFEFDGISSFSNGEVQAALHPTSEVAAAASAPAPLVFSASHALEGFQLQAALAGNFCSPCDLQWLVRQTCRIVEWIHETDAKVNLSALDVIDEEQRNFIMNMAQGPLCGRSLPTATSIHALFEQRVARHPKKIAVQYGSDQFMTYAALDKAADKAASALQAMGIRTGAIVPICMSKSLLLVVATFAALKAGAAYAPVDPSNPADRKARIIEQCKAKVVIVDDSWTAGDVDVSNLSAVHIESLLDHAHVDMVSDRSTNVDFSRELAYCIFTSGSTGLPKGVMVEHGQILSFIMSREGMAFESAFGRRLNFTSTAFDATVGDMFGALSHGATLIMTSTADLLQDLDSGLTELMVTNLLLTPTFAAPLASSHKDVSLPWTASLLVGGEKVEAELRNSICHRVALENAYGPTEASVQTLAYRFQAERRYQQGYVPIGKPTGWSKVYIVHPDSTKLLPVGAIGELCIGGPQVARGYLNDEEKTRAKFVSDPFVEGGRMFRTGDLGRLHGDGLFECLGRIDGQVKIRGLRIETGEIEAAIAADQNVDQAKVLKMQLADEVDRLVGFVVLHGDDDKGADGEDELSPRTLDTELANQLWA